MLVLNILLGEPKVLASRGASRSTNSRVCLLVPLSFLFFYHSPPSKHLKRASSPFLRPPPLHKACSLQPLQAHMPIERHPVPDAIQLSRVADVDASYSRSLRPEWVLDFQRSVPERCYFGNYAGGCIGA
ncbi:hypothetical protein BU26DRAFT_35932 [Trematosphaeria pertusa]|uniref:Uncharacterized protein n=1 Tax=Trematosphaeria pertusa TaxID=390896 RepID=A0A6A6J3E2_9PLEO|nr:uncharacterized protein BU26DRAFT_35932 [Trematosphaeria pertusa]KAF2257088.1 hypothetical protein BU26DRAFT_35932 [Trematosphaeria pertusa]